MTAYSYRPFPNERIVDAFDIVGPYGGRMAQITFWPDEEDSWAEAEADAKLICAALNAYKPTNPDSA
jgi:hypothetical protein